MQSRSVSRVRIFLFLALTFLGTARATMAATGTAFEMTFFIRTNDTRGQIVTRRFNSVTGPQDHYRLFNGVRLLPTGITNEWLGIEAGRIIRVRDGGSAIPEPTNGLDLNDWAMSLTYDSARNRTVLVTLSGEGFIYERPAASDHWSVVASMQNEDLQAWTYRPVDDAFWGIEVYNGAPSVLAKFVKYSPTGGKVSELYPGSFEVNVSPSGATAEMVAAGTNIFICVERPYAQALQGDDRSRIYRFTPSPMSFNKTWESSWPQNPNLQILQPTNNTTVFGQQSVTVRATAFDADADLTSVVFMEGTRLVKSYTFQPGPWQTNAVLEFAWTPETAGVHTLTARATDAPGGTCETYVTVNVVYPEVFSFSIPFLAGNTITNVTYNTNGPTTPGLLFRGVPTTPVGSAYYGKQSQSIVKFDSPTRATTVVPVSGNVPDLSWPRGVTFDAIRQKLVVVSLGGEGYLYTLDPATGLWSLINSMQNVDVDSIAYSFYDQRFYMVENSGGNSLRILRYKTDGTPDGAITIPDVPFQVGHYYQSAIGLSKGNKLGILIEPMPGVSVEGPIESRMYIVDLLTGGSTLAYRKVWDAWPPGPKATVSVARDLPDIYIPGAAFSVKLTATPNSVSAWAIEEQPPAGWTVSTKDYDGFFDATSGKLKWGPFTDNQPRTFFYSAKPPTNSTEVATFTGTVSVNGVSSAITGDERIRCVELHHPADLSPEDSKMTIDEVTAYAFAWKSGAAWSKAPNPIPLSYVTRAGFLWKHGEAYTFVTNALAPNSWVPLPLKGQLPVAPDTTPGEAIRKLWPAFTPGHPVNVSILVKPAPGTSAYALEEQIPAGWTLENPGDGSNVGTMLRFGPFFDAQERTLTYSLTPPPNAVGAEFRGAASFDGSDDPIAGAAELRPPSPTAERVDDRHVRLRFNATPGEHYVVESADSIDSAAWLPVAEIVGAETPVELPPVEAAASARFYRLRPNFQ